MKLLRSGFRINAAAFNDQIQSESIGARSPMLSNSSVYLMFPLKQKGRVIPRTRPTHSDRGLVGLLSISRDDPFEFAIARAESRIARGGRGSSGAPDCAFSLVRTSNQIPTITSPRSELVYLLGAKTGSVLQSNGVRRPL